MMTNIYDLIKENITPGQEWIWDNCIFLSRAGSWLYGTNNNDSDQDFIGITYSPIEYWVGFPNFDMFQLKIPEQNIELTIYDIRKYIRLAFGSNPNIIEAMFIEPDNPNIRLWSDAWTSILNLRDSLISNRAKNTFGGFGSSQYKKLQNRQANKPSRKDLISEYGYDTKFCMHGVRILQQGGELLTTGEITLPRPNKEELCMIRENKFKDAGSDTYSIGDFNRSVRRVKDEIDIFNRICDENMSILPEKPNQEKVSSFLVDFFRKYVSN